MMAAWTSLGSSTHLAWRRDRRARRAFTASTAASAGAGACSLWRRWRSPGGSGAGTRQKAGAALRPRLDQREALWVCGDDVRAAVDPDKLAAWGEAPVILPWRWLRAVLLVVSLGVAAVLAAWAGGRLPAAAAGLAA